MGMRAALQEFFGKKIFRDDVEIDGDLILKKYANVLNSNGRYIQFADGTMICIGIAATVTTSNAVGSVFYNTATFTFPVAFIAAPMVTITMSVSTGLSWPGPATSVITTGFTGTIIGAAGTSSGTFSYVAIGRWK